MGSTPWAARAFRFKPVVASSDKPTGFILELICSTLQYFSSTRLASADIWIQRRAYTGIPDIPTLCYHFAKTDNGDSHRSTSLTLHRNTIPGIELVNGMFTTKGVESVRDAVTGSRFNLEFASIAINIIEQGVVGAKIPGSAFGVITPYAVQIHTYNTALRYLYLRNPTAGFDKVLIGTTDSMQGSKAPIVIFDTRVTNALGFTNDRGRF
ncbi:hypothetical protein V493_08099 [Pseudogymnoascus sp. VKM F-4281 (FW-2241)]|nr:hypothetical protein V493_08099 [Pseudogymnoascus sp. VKM F-4281 (FW-2241)]